MNKNDQNTKETEEFNVNHRLDITPYTCPMTFVRTKLMIEKMAPGEIVEVRLKGAEPLENVPRSVTDMGHTVLALQAEELPRSDDGVFRLLVRKN